MAAGGMGGVRPPPPEYKAAAQAQMMHAGIGMGQQARFPNAGPMRRVTQQPMPPSGWYKISSGTVLRLLHPNSFIHTEITVPREN